MTKEEREPILVLRAKGPATEGGRLPLADLMKIGRNVQLAVERVARVLVGQADSRRPGRKPQEIARECALEVVALNRGSFEIALDLPRRKFEGMDLGIEAVERLLEGWNRLDGDGGVLPPGYDIGVLHSLRDLGQVLGPGIEEIVAQSRTQRLRRTFAFDEDVRLRVARQISAPVTGQRTVEGRLLMADFRHDGEKCRIHPPIGEPITCFFEESLEETVQELLRTYVRVAGETTEDPATGRITSIRIGDIEPVSLEGEAFETTTPEQFWEDKSLEQLAVEQAVRPVCRLEEVLGKGAGLWESDDEFEAFLAAIKESREKDG